MHSPMRRHVRGTAEDWLNDRPELVVVRLEELQGRTVRVRGVQHRGWRPGARLRADLLKHRFSFGSIERYIGFSAAVGEKGGKPLASRRPGTRPAACDRRRGRAANRRRRSPSSASGWLEATSGSETKYSPKQGAEGECVRGPGDERARFDREELPFLDLLGGTVAGPAKAGFQPWPGGRGDGSGRTECEYRRRTRDSRWRCRGAGSRMSSETSPP